MTTLHQFGCDIETRGWSILERAVDADRVRRMRADCLKWVDICARVQVKNGINQAGDGTAHHSLGLNDSLDEFIDSGTAASYLDCYFDGGLYILHAINPVSGAPGATNYVHKIHRDVRTYIPGKNIRMNMLVMLDDFTMDNGATHVLEGSHRLDRAPDREYFDANYRSLVGPAGSIVLFNSYLWHRGGTNTTQQNRVALTLSFNPPFLKPQMDYARMLGESYFAGVTERTRQILGYNSRVPASLDEWYQPEATRLYKSNQG